MCEANAVDRLLSLNFVGLPNEVETALAFKVRNADPLSRPMYPQVLYAWYVFRGDFRNGEWWCVLFVPVCHMFLFNLQRLRRCIILDEGFLR